MIQPDAQTLKDAVRLRGSALEDYLKQIRGDALERLSNASEAEFRLIQGEAKAYRSLLRLIDTSRSTLDKSENKHDMSKSF